MTSAQPRLPACLTVWLMPVWLLTSQPDCLLPAGSASITGLILHPAWLLATSCLAGWLATHLASLACLAAICLAAAACLPQTRDSAGLPDCLADCQQPHLPSLACLAATCLAAPACLTASSAQRINPPSHR